jgi:hypothetical protein
MCQRAAYDDGGFSGATMDRPALQQLPSPPTPYARPRATRFRPPAPAGRDPCGHLVGNGGAVREHSGKKILTFGTCAGVRSGWTAAVVDRAFVNFNNKMLN